MTDKATVETISGSTLLSVSALTPMGSNRDAHDPELEALSESIKQHGLLQAIIVRRAQEGEDGEYKIVAGERRWRATQLAGNATIEARILPDDTNDRDIEKMRFAENNDRKDLTPHERAAALICIYQQHRAWHEHRGMMPYTVAQLAEDVNLSEMHVRRLMRLGGNAELMTFSEEGHLPNVKILAMLGTALDSGKAVRIKKARQIMSAFRIKDHNPEALAKLEALNAQHGGIEKAVAAYLKPQSKQKKRKSNPGIGKAKKEG